MPSLSWWKDGQQLASGDHWQVEEKRDEQHLLVSSTVSVTSADVSIHAGQVLVKAENQAGHVEQPVEVICMYSYYILYVL